jgi:hypothetical protein
MPLRDFTCKKCGKTQERFYWASKGIPDCECGGILEMLPLTNDVRGKTGIFPYTCTHVDGNGTPITIESLGHLRKVEKQYGVVFSAFSQNRNNPDHIRDLPRHKVGGREY